jgi:hypothetical protein
VSIAKDNEGKLTIGDIDELRGSKDLELQIEMKHNVNLQPETSDREEDTGHERWRADVPSEFAGKTFMLNAVGYVSISDHRVLLNGEGAKLLAWDAATGNRVG